MLFWLAEICFAQPVLLVVGDSLSAAFQIPPESGWVALLEHKLKTIYPTATVINSSIVGDTSANALARLPRLLEKYHPDIIIIEMGGNDGLRGLPLVALEANLRNMILLSLKAHSKVLLCEMRLPPNYGPSYTESFQKIYTQLSVDYKISLVPFLLEKVALDPKLMLSDRLHPNAQAQALLLEAIWPVLKAAL